MFVMQIPLVLLYLYIEAVHLFPLILRHYHGDTVFHTSYYVRIEYVALYIQFEMHSLVTKLPALSDSTDNGMILTRKIRRLRVRWLL